MNIIPIDLQKKLEVNKDRHNAFFYNYYTSDIAEFTHAADRWKDKKKLLQEIAEEITKENLKWQDIEFLNKERNLAGTQFKRAQLIKRLYALDHTNLDFCYFDFCKFLMPEPDKDSNTYDTLFWNCSLKNAFFKNCKFENVAFSGGVFKCIVFYDCKFNDVVFNKNKDGEYGFIFFQNCTFKNSDFSNVNMQTFCFWGDCEFENLKYDYDLLPKNAIIGKEIIQLCHKWDSESYMERNRNHYVGGPYSKLEIAPFGRSEETIIVKKYSSVINCYDGLIKFYKQLAAYEDVHGEHLFFLKYSYLHQLIKDEKVRVQSKFIGKYKGFFSRYVLGYGCKAGRPLISFWIMVLFFSFLYLFNGIETQSTTINRDLVFKPQYFLETIDDWGTCIYYSTVTATTIGYGDIHPANELTRFFVCMQGFLGILMMTLFTVIFGRRFFK